MESDESMMNFADAPINPPSTNATDQDDDLQQVREYLIDTMEVWLPRLLPYGKKHGNTFRCGSLAGEKGMSFAMRLAGEDRGTWIDHATGEKGDVFTLIQKILSTDFKGALEIGREMANIPMRKVTSAMLKVSDEERRAYNQQLIGQILRESVCVKDVELIRKYLMGRSLMFPTTPDLLAHKALLHFPTKRRFPSLVALVRSVEGNIVGLHRTYICPDTHKKADVEPNKMMLGKCAGGAVHLASPISEMLGISEGIETGLAAMQMSGVPVWAALSTSGMRSIKLPSDVHNVVIFADGGAHYDPILKRMVRPGEEAAQELSLRLTSEGKRVRICRPKHGDDFAHDLEKANEK